MQNIYAQQQKKELISDNSNAFKERKKIQRVDVVSLQSKEFHIATRAYYADGLAKNRRYFVTTIKFPALNILSIEVPIEIVCGPFILSQHIKTK